jgi:hypothetical protein
MRKILTALVASAIVGATTLGTSSAANAGGWPFFWGGLAAGAITGAVVGSALAAPYYYPPHPYYGPYPYYGPGCRPVWNGYAWVRSCY